MLHLVGNISKGIYLRCADTWTLNAMRFCGHLTQYGDRLQAECQRSDLTPHTVFFIPWNRLTFLTIDIVAWQKFVKRNDDNSSCHGVFGGFPLGCSLRSTIRTPCVETIFVHPPVCWWPSINNENFCRSFMKVSTRVNCERLSQKGEFSENLFSGCCLLFVGVKEFVVYFQCFSTQLKLGVRIHA